MRKNILIVASGILLLIPILFSAIDLPRTAPPLQSATLLPEAMALPDFQLTDQDGATFTRQSFKDRFSLVFFGFTHCPDICPATLQQLAVARKRLKQSGNSVPDVVFISVDPNRDSPDVVGSYVSNFGEGFIGLTGDMDDLRELTSGLGIYFEYGEGDADNYDVSHSVAILAVNRDAELQALFSAPHNIDKIVNDVPRLMATR